MRCPKCGNVLTEYLDEEQELGVYCEKCGLMMSIDESVYKLVEYSDDDIEATMLYNEDIKLMEIHTNGESCMSDYVHKCLRCNEYGFEVAPGEFECVSCGFSWEVTNLE